MSKKSAAGLVAWAKQAYANGWVYWYGTCGYKCTTSLLSRKTAQYPDHYGDNRQAKYKQHVSEGRVCSDCIGLFKSYAWDEDGDIETRDSDYGSNGQPDNGASTTLKKATVKGSISTMPEIPGLALWTKTGGHIGLYIGNGEVIELRGFAYGSQKNKVSKRSFTTWGLYPFVEYTEEQVAIAKAAADISTSTGSTTVRAGSTGDAVREIQELLNAAGYDCGKADGICGANTVSAITKFQQENGLEADGICGSKTWAALRAAKSSSDVPKVEVEEVPKEEEKTPTAGKETAETGESEGKTVTVELNTQKKGRKNKQVKTIQRLLNALGHDCGSVDGNFGSKTVAAVKAFQQENGLSADGVVGSKTWNALLK